MSISKIDGVKRRVYDPVSKTEQVQDDPDVQDEPLPDMQNLMAMIDQLLKMLLQGMQPQQGGSDAGGNSGNSGSGGGGGSPSAPPVSGASRPAPSAPPAQPSAPQPQGTGSGGGGQPGGASPASASSASGSGSAPAAGASGAAESAGPPSGNYIDAKAYGVVGDGKTDDTAALQKALDAGKASGQQVYLGAGTYAHSGTLNLDGVKLNGDGEKTVLKATNPDQSAIKLTGDGASLSNVKAEVDGAPNRSSQPDAAAVLVQNASNASVSNVVTQGAASNGIRLDNAQDSTISHNLVQGSNADGIALMNGSSHNTISQNVVYQAGDDSFSDDSYTSDARQDTGNVFDGNMALDGKYGRGFALMGSTGDTVTHNIVNGVSGVGIATGTDANSGTMAGGGDTVSGNTVVNENDANSGNGTPTTPQAVLDQMGQLPGVAQVLGWEATLVDKAKYDTAYQAGTGDGANNAGGVRS